MSALHLRRIELRATAHDSGFPFSVPAIRDLPPVGFDTPVTFFAGENGSGKSTLLEAIAVSARLPVVGSEEADRDETLSLQRELGRALKLTWSRRAPYGFFLRAEDFFGFARRIARMRAELMSRLEDVEREYADASAHTRGLAAGPARASLAELERLYGGDVDARSHGEAFLHLFESRLRANSLYLLDEPEAALSPQSQLGLLALIATAVAEGSQFIIATHSPILLAYPHALIYSFDTQPISVAQYGELEHVTLTRAFLNSPNAFLRRLMQAEREE